MEKRIIRSRIEISIRPAAKEIDLKLTPERLIADFKNLLPDFKSQEGMADFLTLRNKDHKRSMIFLSNLFHIQLSLEKNIDDQIDFLYQSLNKISMYFAENKFSFDLQYVFAIAEDNENLTLDKIVSYPKVGNQAKVNITNLGFDFSYKEHNYFVAMSYGKYSLNEGEAEKEIPSFMLGLRHVLEINDPLDWKTYFKETISEFPEEVRSFIGKTFI